MERLEVRLHKEVVSHEELFVGTCALQVCLPGWLQMFVYIIYLLVLLTHSKFFFNSKSKFDRFLHSMHTTRCWGTLKTQGNTLSPSRVLHLVEDRAVKQQSNLMWQVLKWLLRVIWRHRGKHVSIIKRSEGFLFKNLVLKNDYLMGSKKNIKKVFK